MGCHLKGNLEQNRSLAFFELTMIKYQDFLYHVRIINQVNMLKT